MTGDLALLHDANGWLWTGDGKLITTLGGHKSVIYVAGFFQGDTRVVTTTRRGTVHSHMVDFDELLSETIGLTDRSLTPRERERYHLPPAPPGSTTNGPSDRE